MYSMPHKDKNNYCNNDNDCRRDDNDKHINSPQFIFYLTPLKKSIKMPIYYNQIGVIIECCKGVWYNEITQVFDFCEQSVVIVVKDGNIAKIENLMLQQKYVFCEFLTCLNNKGLCDIITDFKDDNNFCFCRYGKDFGINDLFIYSNDYMYFQSVVSRFNDATCMTVIFENNFDFSCITKAWEVTVRKQFVKTEARRLKSCEGFVKLNQTHTKIIEKSTSETVKSNFAVGIEFGDECYAIIKDELCCFVSVSKVKGLKMAEVNWIYTEPKHRNQGYATQLLSQVANKLANEGYTVTYHCASENVASSMTALHGGFEETVKEFVLERV